MNQFKLDSLGDIFTPADLAKAKFPGGKYAAYALCHRTDFPVIRNGKRFLITKSAFVRWLEDQAQAQ